MSRIKNPKKTATNAIGTIANHGENTFDVVFFTCLCSNRAIFCSNSLILASLSSGSNFSSKLNPQKEQNFSADSIFAHSFDNKTSYIKEQFFKNEFNIIFINRFKNEKVFL